MKTHTEEPGLCTLDQRNTTIRLISYYTNRLLIKKLNVYFPTLYFRTNVLVDEFIQDCYHLYYLQDYFVLLTCLFLLSDFL